MQIQAELQTLLNDPELVIDECIQSLWSGYGQIVRCHNKQQDKSFVVKVVAPANAKTHPRGWNTSVGHKRKLTSYQVEANFYQQYASATDQYCKVPQLITSKITKDYTLLVLEDLDQSGYFVRKEQADWQSLSIAIKWLAFFHIKYLNKSAQALWPTGCYWHLATRQDELKAMKDSAFKQHAKQLDSTLSNAEFKTLVHGDAKFANLCFHHNGRELAAVDFQYVGQGSGVKDLAYMVGSCLTDEQLYEFDLRIVDEYLHQINLAVNHYGVDINIDAFEQEIRYLYPIAWADFYRFLLGWNPQSWKIGQFMHDKSHQGLALLKR